MTRYLNGIGTEYPIDNRPGKLDPDQMERQLKFAKELGLSKLGIHLCHLEKLIEAYREKTGQPKRDWRRTIGAEK
jgi:hypothetical protein